MINLYEKAGKEDTATHSDIFYLKKKKNPNQVHELEPSFVKSMQSIKSTFWL